MSVSDIDTVAAREALDNLSSRTWQDAAARTVNAIRQSMAYLDFAGDGAAVREQADIASRSVAADTQQSSGHAILKTALTMAQDAVVDVPAYDSRQSLPITPAEMRLIENALTPDDSTAWADYTNNEKRIFLFLRDDVHARQALAHQRWAEQRIDPQGQPLDQRLRDLVASGALRVMGQLPGGTVSPESASTNEATPDAPAEPSSRFVADFARRAVLSMAMTMCPPAGATFLGYQAAKAVARKAASLASRPGHYAVNTLLGDRLNRAGKQLVDAAATKMAGARWIDVNTPQAARERLNATSQEWGASSKKGHLGWVVSAYACAGMAGVAFVGAMYGTTPADTVTNLAEYGGYAFRSAMDTMQYAADTVAGNANTLAPGETPAAPANTAMEPAPSGQPGIAGSLMAVGAALGTINALGRTQRVAATLKQFFKGGRAAPVGAGGEEAQTYTAQQMKKHAQQGAEYAAEQGTHEMDVEGAATDMACEVLGETFGFECHGDAPPKAPEPSPCPEKPPATTPERDVADTPPAQSEPGL